MAASESGRIYIVLDRIEQKLDRVGERLAAVEVKSHTPEECAGVRRVEHALDRHVEDARTAAAEAARSAMEVDKDRFWRGWGKEALKLAAAVGAGFVGSKG